MSNPFEEAAGAYEARTFEDRLRTLEGRRPFVFPSGAIPETFRRSSVLICFWRQENDLSVLLTRRAATLSRHPGQMAFPGGRLEAGEDWVMGALRETEEEVGIPRERIEVLGRLDDAWSGAGHLLVPIVGWLDEAPSYAPNPDEVAEVHEPRLSKLLEPDAYEEEPVELDDGRYINPILRWQSGHVFGLSTDLLIEAIRWGLGLEGAHGPRRLESLHAFLRTRGDPTRKPAADRKDEQAR